MQLERFYSDTHISGWSNYLVKFLNTIKNGDIGTSNALCLQNDNEVGFLTNNKRKKTG